jgi:hypothetical protein
MASQSLSAPMSRLVVGPQTDTHNQIADVECHTAALSTVLVFPSARSGPED